MPNGLNTGKSAGQERYNKVSAALVALFLVFGALYFISGSLPYLLAKQNPFYPVYQFEGNPQHIYILNRTIAPLDLHLAGMVIVDPTLYGNTMVATLTVTNKTNFLEGTGGVVAVNLLNGSIIWTDKFPNDVMTQPLIINNMAIIGLGNAVFNLSSSVVNGTEVKRATRGNGINFIAALNMTTGKVIWKYSTAGTDMPTPVYYDGMIIEGDGNAEAFAVNATTGKLIWDTSLFMTGIPYHASSANPNITIPQANSIVNTPVTGNFQINTSIIGSPIIGNPVIGSPIAGSPIANRYTFVDQGTTIGPLGYFDSMSSPVLLNGIIYLGATEPGGFYAINATNGKIIWYAAYTGSRGGSGGMSPAICIKCNTVISGYNGPNSFLARALSNNKSIQPILVGVNLTDGHIMWRFDEGTGYQPVKPPITLPSVTVWDGTVFSDTLSIGVLYAINATTGHLVWKFDSGPDLSNPTVYNGYVFLVNFNGTEITLTTSGRLVAEHNLGVPMGPADPIVVGNQMLVYGFNGVVKTVPLSYLETNST